MLSARTEAGFLLPSGGDAGECTNLAKILPLARVEFLLNFP